MASGVEWGHQSTGPCLAAFIKREKARKEKKEGREGVKGKETKAGALNESLQDEKRKAKKPSGGAVEGQAGRRQAKGRAHPCR